MVWLVITPIIMLPMPSRAQRTLDEPRHKSPHARRGEGKGRGIRENAQCVRARGRPRERIGKIGSNEGASRERGSICEIHMHERE